MSFPNALLLPSLALVSVPIIIHYFLTRRKVIIHWAAFEFIRRAMLKKKNKIDKQNLLQLLLRILAILFLVLALSKPLIGSNSSAEKTLLLIDSSYSMQAQEDGISRFEKAKKMARTWMTNAPSGSQFLIGKVDREVDLIANKLSDNSTELLNGLEGLEPSSVSCTMVESLARVMPQIDTFHPSKVVIFSDFNQLGKNEEFKQRLASFPPEVSLKLMPVSAALETANVAVTNLSSDAGLVLMNRPSTFGVDVFNSGRSARKDYKLTFKVDGQPVGEVVQEIPPQIKTLVTFVYTFRDNKAHQLVVTGPSDSLELDNTANAHITPLSIIKIACLDSAPESSDPYDHELVLFEAAFANLVSQEAVKIEKFNAINFPWAKLSDYHVVVLGNYCDVGPSNGEAVSRFVKNGGGLLLFPGARIRMDDWNTWAAREPGLLPCTLEEQLTSRDEKGFRISPKTINSPIFGYLKENEGALERITFRKLYTLKPAADATVLASFTNPPVPVGVTKSYGRGNVFAFAFPANRAWSDLAIQPAFVAFSIRSAMLSMGPPPRENAICGDTLVFRLPPDLSGAEMTMDVPGKRTTKVLSVFKDEQAEVRFGTTNEPGFYSLNKEGKDYGGYAVNVDGLDSELTPASSSEMISVTQGSDHVSLAGDSKTMGPGGFSIVFPLLILAMLCIAGETLVTFRSRK